MPSKFPLLFCFMLTVGQLSAQNGSFMHDGVLRTYIVYLPTGFTSSDTLPLVFCLHGLFQSPGRIAEVSGFDTIADRERFITCYPKGVDSTWNSFGSPMTGVDDVGFLSALIDTLNKDYHINLNRVYSTGMSNGGFMSYSLACRLSERIAAIASVCGSMTDSMMFYCQPSRPMPVMEIHGDADWIVNYNGGFVGIGGLGNKSIASVMQYWVQYNGCPSAEVVSQIPDFNTTDNSTVSKLYWGTCNEETEVIHYKVNGGGHTWPASSIDFNGLGGNVNHDLAASEEIWEFFSRYTLNGKINTALQSIEHQFELIAYPNPVEDLLTVNFRNAISPVIRLTDIFGKEILKIETPESSFDLSFKTVPPGIYFLSFAYNGRVVIKKVVRS